MNTEELSNLLRSKTWRVEFMETDDSRLRLFLQDLDSGDCGLLAIEPSVLVLPDEAVLDYSYQDISAELGPSEHLYDITTRVEPDFPKGSVPFLFD